MSVISAVTAGELHVITGEYPPTRGGVADYTAEVSRAIAGTGDAVHVWCPGGEVQPSLEQGVSVHRTLGAMRPADFARVDAQLAQFPSPRRLLVQWVPHAFGQRSMNLAFCRWISRRAGAGDALELMVHEPYLPFALRPRQVVAATVHRLMTMVLLRSACRVWLATPAWGAMLRPYAFGRDVPFTWLPEPASVPVCATSELARSAVRARYLTGDGCLIGSFSTSSPLARTMLPACVGLLLERFAQSRVLLIGNTSAAMRDVVAADRPSLAGWIHATGPLDAADASQHLAACDIALQAYPDGVCTRHSSAMTVLAHGVPMVTTAGRLTEDFWHASGAVTLVAVGDPLAMADAAASLVSDREERGRLGRRALELYRQRFDVRHTVAALRGEPRCA